MKRIALITLLLTVATAGLAFGAMKGSADVVKTTATPVAVTSVAGERVAFTVKVDIAERWHLYAHGDTNFIGVDLVPDEGFPLEDFKADYPKGHEKEFFGDLVMMIEGKEKIEASALVPAGLEAGEHDLNLKLTVQACDDKTCLAPAFLPVTLKLTVE